ncbi:MAG: hypothetical protein MZU97_24965 [Bacillus subtilis]|nr:hypothetical protein [Bacillus subtilis]
MVFDDIDSFDGEIDLTLFYDPANRDILLHSAAMHATISDQLLDLGDDFLVVPYEDVDLDAIRLATWSRGIRNRIRRQDRNQRDF